MLLLVLNTLTLLQLYPPTTVTALSTHNYNEYLMHCLTLLQPYSLGAETMLNAYSCQHESFSVAHIVR